MENFLSLDGNSGEIVRGYKGEKLYCKVIASNYTINDTEFIKIESNGVPNYTPTIKNIVIKGNWNKELKEATDGEEGNPNSIESQTYNFLIPKVPVGDGNGWVKNRRYNLPMGAIGISINGVPFYNQWADREETADANETEEFDSCCGHPDGNNKYHYHQYPMCASGNSALNRMNVSNTATYLENLVISQNPSPIIGYMFDGVPITGPVGYDTTGNVKILKSSFNDDKEYEYLYGDLDQFNGISSPLVKNGENVYHYVATVLSNDDGSKPLFDNDGEIIPSFPYLINQYKYTPEDTNF